MCVNGPFLAWAGSMCRGPVYHAESQQRELWVNNLEFREFTAKIVWHQHPEFRCFTCFTPDAEKLFIYFEKEVAMKKSGILGQNIFRIMGLKWCLDKEAWGLSCVVLRFSSSGLTIKYANWENRNFNIFSKIHSFQFSSATLKNHSFNWLGWVFLLLCICLRIYWSDQACP